MSSKYYWNNIDVANISGVSTGTDYTNSAGDVIFKSFPGVKSTTLSGFQTYTENETNPPFYDNNVSIFRNIVVANESKTTGSGTITKPSWANACKIYVQSKKGDSGIAGNSVNAVNNSVNTDENTNTNHNFNENNNNNTKNLNNFNRNKNENHWIDNRNRRHHHNVNLGAGIGGTGGAGGSAFTFATLKALQVNNSDTFHFAIDSTTTDFQIKRSDSTVRSRVKLINGSNGTNGTNAVYSETPVNVNHTAVNDMGAAGFGGDPKWTVNAAHLTTATGTVDISSLEVNHTTTNNASMSNGTNGSTGIDGYRHSTHYAEFENYSVTSGLNSAITTQRVTIYWFKV
tara:strand:- start:316 stop:1344 length:1029 start_codon:yes stop_codon:yes gene_type:complete